MWLGRKGELKKKEDVTSNGIKMAIILRLNTRLQTDEVRKKDLWKY